MFWYATAMAAPIQQLMLLNTKGDIMKKKKKLIKVDGYTSCDRHCGRNSLYM